MAEEGATKTFCDAETQTIQQQKLVEDQKMSKGSDNRDFNVLPGDLMEMILERLLRPSDLKNACLVNKQFHELAVRFLYRNVAFDLGTWNDHKLSAFLNPNNIGLRHIKQLRLYLASDRSDRRPSSSSSISSGHRNIKHDQQAHFAIRMILEFLPEDILEEFSWCPWKPFSIHNLLLLYKKQRKLKLLEAMDVDRDAMSELKKQPTLLGDIAKHAHKLGLYPDKRKTLNLCGMYVEKCAEQLEDLVVHCNFNLGARLRGVESRDMNDSATAPGLVTRAIFAHMIPFEQCRPFPKLKALRLHRVGLRYCADTWCKFINFAELQALRVYSCPGADSLFGQLSKASYLPKRLKALEVQHKDNEENEALLALDNFLCLVSGLEELAIDLEKVKAMPSVASIAKHGKTLQLLNVHCATDLVSNGLSVHEPTEELVWDVDHFDQICKACPGLEQLSCAWPDTHVLRGPSQQWKAYERACAHLRDLVTLHISTWPSNKPASCLLPRAVYEYNVRALAQRGFELAAGVHASLTKPPSRPSSPATSSEDDSDGEFVIPQPPPPPGAGAAPVPPGDASSIVSTSQIPPFPLRAGQLRLVAFGVSDKIYDRQDSRHQLIFLRSSCIDADGQTRPYATPIGWCLRQFVEPRSDVLEFVLLRCEQPNVPPWRLDGMARNWTDDDDEV